MPLTNADPHYWAPQSEIVNRLAQKYDGKRILEVGPGQAPFPAATDFVDWQDAPPHVPKERFSRHDVSKGLPWASGEFDFCYCRHVLEDMANPFHLMNEMSRVAKAGYIETPSPVCELTRGVDGGSPAWRGYNHHRWLIWEEQGELRFLTKFPIVEHLPFNGEPLWERALRSTPRAWNTSFLWEGEIKSRHLQCPHDFAMPQDYPALLEHAAAASVLATDRFWRNMSNGP